VVPALSFWQNDLGEPPPVGPALSDTVSADVCVIGGGYTGLWTAWALLALEPTLRVVILEAVRVGFGASGRNGGWLSGLMPGERAALAREPGGRDGVVALQRLLVDAVDQVIAICSREQIDADIVKGGTLTVATNAAQMSRLEAAVEEDHRWGLTATDVHLVDGAPGVRVTNAVGASFSPHCARVQPAKLVRGLAEAVEKRGATVYPGSPVVSVEPGRVRTPTGSVRAPWIVRATEGYTASIPGYHRALLPMNSSIIITSPLPASAWEEIGWSNAETIRDGAHAYVYLQRTAEGRIAIGGRGRPYRFGSKLEHVGVTPPSTVAALQNALHRLFPVLAKSSVTVDAAWSGVLGVARDWCPTVGIEPWEPDGGLAWAGGYVGDGVTTSHLAGLTLADLILGRSTERTAMPWVGHRARSWEPEPLRWLGVKMVYGLYRAADRAESRHRDQPATSRWAELASVLAGRH
jgi:glycine/D-amino acid oxidase-like deaminating enzyme